VGSAAGVTRLVDSRDSPPALADDQADELLPGELLPDDQADPASSTRTASAARALANQDWPGAAAPPARATAT
jgi:hypothetical protein